MKARVRGNNQANFWLNDLRAKALRDLAQPMRPYWQDSAALIPGAGPRLTSDCKPRARSRDDLVLPEMTGPCCCERDLGRPQRARMGSWATLVGAAAMREVTAIGSDLARPHGPGPRAEASGRAGRQMGLRRERSSAQSIMIGFVRILTEVVHLPCPSSISACDRRVLA